MSSISRKKANAISKKIDKFLKREAKQNSDKGRRMILLGTGDSGKSTFLKQLKILHGDGFSKEERQSFKTKIQNNIFDSLFLLCDASMYYKLSPSNEQDFEDLWKFIYNNSKKGGLVRMLANKSPIALPDNIIDLSQRMWDNDKGFSMVFQTKANFIGFQDTAPYFLKDIKKYYQEDYIPTDDDILQCRVATTSITETQLNISENKFRIIDVGGQRSLRAYWLPYFDDSIKGIIFIVSLASYDQYLNCKEDDEQTNKMEDAIKLFESICNFDILRKAAFILFLNKTDIFERKIKISNVKDYFPAFEGNSSSLKDTGLFFKDLLLIKNHDLEKNIYVHFTNSTDTKLMKKMIATVSDLVLRINLGSYGVH